MTPKDCLRAPAIRIMLFVAIVGTGCHRKPSLEPIPSAEEYCWWSSQYVALPPVLLASQFQSALVAAGFANAHWVRNGDSAWAIAGPAHVPASPTGAAYAFRVVAYVPRDAINCAWRGNSEAPIARRPIGAESCFHANVFIYPPEQGWASKDSVAAISRVLPLCSTVYQSALAGLERLQ